MVPDETHQSNENRTREEKIMSITRTRPAVWTLTVLLLIGMTVPACAPKDAGTQEPDPPTKTAIESENRTMMTVTATGMTMARTMETSSV